MKKIGPYVLIALLAFMAYGPILWNGAGFSHPDDAAAIQIKCCGFRPLLALTYQFNQRFGGWMAVNLGLHVLVAWMLLYLSKMPVAAALFAVHPMAADAVASVSGRSAEILAISVLAGILVYQRSRVAGAVLGVFLAGGAMAFVPSYFGTIQGAPARWAYTKQAAAEIVLSVIPKMVVPIGLTAEPVSPHGSAVWFIILAAWLACIPFLLPQYRLPFGLILLPLAAYLFVPLPNGFYEHRAYLSLAGVAILAGLELRRMPRAALLIVPAFLVMAEARTFAYASPVHLWEAAVRQDPTNGRAIVNLGGYYARVDRWYEAQDEFERAIRVAPEISLGWTNLAYVHVLRGQIGDASRVLDSYDEYRKSHKMKG